MIWTRIQKWLLFPLCIIFILTGIDCSWHQSRNRSSVKQFLYQADIFFYQHDIQKTIKILHQAIKNYPDNPEAYRRLALYQATFLRSFNKAVINAETALRLQPTSPEIHRSLGQIYAAYHEHDLAIKHLSKAIQPDAPYNFKTHYLLAESYVARGDTNRAMVTLKNGLEIEPCYGPSNRLLHRLLVARGHYAAALDLWRADNFVINKDESFGDFWEHYTQLNEAVRDVAAHPLKPEANLKLAMAYFDAFLFTESKIVLEKIIRGNPTFKPAQKRWDITTAYLAFINEIKHVAESHYLRTINNTPNNLVFWQETWQAFSKMARFYPELGPPPLKYNETYFKQLRTKISATFRCHINIGVTDDVLDLHFGHIVGTELRQINIWGRHLKVKAVYLDYMVDNGFGSWAWLYQTQHGGFSSEDNVYTIYHIRPPFRQSVIRDWWMAHHLPTRQYEASLTDYSLASSSDDPLKISYSPKLQLQLRLKEIDDITHQLKKRFSTLAEQHSYFMTYMLDHKTEASIFNHEGQHAIDRVVTGLNQASLLETRSKLSELFYTPFPFLTLAELMTPDIGAKSAHGRANQQIFQNIVAYIHANPYLFPQINTDKNILQQLPKLDQGQLNEIVKQIFLATETTTSESVFPDPAFPESALGEVGEETQPK